MKGVRKFLLVFLCVNPVLCQDLTVETKLGKIRGVRAHDGDYSMYMGIPYATIDLEHPFGAATPNPRFKDTFIANDDSITCPQIDEYSKNVIGTLDCLRLNIFVPMKSLEPLPVLVFIHGGNFAFGYAKRFIYGPKFLVRHGIILVTFNYRLGPYGFFCLDTPEIPGNQGLLDMVTALRWIRDNIADFGGDPDKVTISGHSSGASSVELLMIAPTERLFQKAIVQSGSALRKKLLLNQANRTAPIILANYLGSKTNDTEEAVKFLANVDALTVAETTRKLNIKVAPCVQKHFSGVENLMPVHPEKANYIHANGTSILFGYTNDEMMPWFGGNSMDYFNSHNFVKEVLSSAFGINSCKVERAIRRFYTGEIGMNSRTKKEIIQFKSDFNILYPAERSLDRYLANGAHLVYQYLFSYDGGRNLLKILKNQTEGGAGHGDELGYLFDGTYLSENNNTGDDSLIVDRITTLWTNFIKYSDPTPTTTNLLPVKWYPVTSQDKRHFVNIDVTMTAGDRPFHDRLAFWDLLDILIEKLHLNNGGKN